MARKVRLTWRCGPVLDLGDLALAQGQFARAATHFEEAIERFRAAGNEWGRAGHAGRARRGPVLERGPAAGGGTVLGKPAAVARHEFLAIVVSSLLGLAAIAVGIRAARGGRTLARGGRGHCRYPRGTHVHPGHSGPRPCPHDVAIGAWGGASSAAMRETGQALRHRGRRLPRPRRSPRRSCHHPERDSLPLSEEAVVSCRRYDARRRSP